MQSNDLDDLYRQASAEYGAALDRLVRAYELDADKRRDLLQEIHLALWRSFEHFEARCSLRTWVYRVAHNTAASHVMRQKRTNARLMSLKEIESMPDQRDQGRETDDRMAIDQLLRLIHQLKPPDREVMLLYLEDLDAAAIGEITGMSAGGVRTQIHRIKTVLARRLRAGVQT
jgi:RNA polymerase sigma-70 factor (ECF subfamily)